MFEMFIRERMNTSLTKSTGAKPALPPGGKFEKRMTSYGGGSPTTERKKPPRPQNGKRTGPTRAVPARPPAPSAPPVMQGGGAKAPLTRFTMYEQGDISREDVTKSVATNNI